MALENFYSNLGNLGNLLERLNLTILKAFFDDKEEKTEHLEEIQEVAEVDEVQKKKDHDLIEEVYSQLDDAIRKVEDDGGTEREALTVVNVIISRNRFSLQRIVERYTSEAPYFDRTRAYDILNQLIFYFRGKPICTNPIDRGGFFDSLRACGLELKPIETE